MSAVDDVLHKLIDVAAGRSNMAPHEADAAHEAVTEGYTAVAPSAADIEAAERVLAAKRAADAAAAAREAGG